MRGELRGFAELLLVAENGPFEFCCLAFSFFFDRTIDRLIWTTFGDALAPLRDLLRDLLYN